MPFNKGERLGRIADFTGSSGRQYHQSKDRAALMDRLGPVLDASRQTIVSSLVYIQSLMHFMRCMRPYSDDGFGRVLRSILVKTFSLSLSLSLSLCSLVGKEQGR